MKVIVFIIVVIMLSGCKAKIASSIASHAAQEAILSNNGKNGACTSSKAACDAEARAYQRFLEERKASSNSRETGAGQK